jgi:hypothetical protein
MDNRTLEIILKARDEASKVLRSVSDEVEKQTKSMKDLAEDAVVPLTAAFATVSGVIYSSISAFEESENATAQLNAVLDSTKGVAGVTAEEVLKLSTALQQQSKFDDEAITGAQSLLLTFTNISKDVFPTATQTVLDMSQALGQDLKSSSIQLGKALQDPIIGVSALRKVGVNFNEEQQNTIKTLVESGKVMDAQKLILKELATEFGGSALSSSKTFSGQITIMKNNIGDLRETLGQGLVAAIMGSGGNLDQVNQALLSLNTFLQQNQDLIIAISRTLIILAVTFGVLLVGSLIATIGAVGALIAAGGLLAGALVFAASMISSNWESIGIFFTNLWQNVTNVFNQAVASITSAVTNIWLTIQPPLQAIFDFFSFIFNGIYNVVSYIGNLLVTLVQFVLMSMFAEVQMQLAMIQAVFEFVWGYIGPYVMQIWEQLKANISVGMAFVKNLINAGLLFIKDQWEGSWKGYFDSAVSWFTKIKDFINQQIENVKNLFKGLADSIVSILTNIHIPSLHLEQEEKDFMGQKVSVPKMKWYENGGWVPSTGPAVLHAGEFVMSKDMMAGRQSVPSNVYNNSAGPTINLGGVTVNSETDINLLSQRLAYAFNNSGRY